MGGENGTLPETNGICAPEKSFFGDDFLFGPRNFSRVFAVSFREGSNYIVVSWVTVWLVEIRPLNTGVSNHPS